MKMIVEKTLEAGVEGHRADIVMSHAARAIAALEGRLEVTKGDIDEAAYFVLPHRARPLAPQEPQQPDDPEQHVSKQQENRDNDDEQTGRQEQRDQPDHQDSGQSQKPRFRETTKNFAVGDPFEVLPFGHRKDKRFRSGAGRRSQTKTSSSSGRYIYPTMHRRNNDLALDATIRAAAPHQLMRDRRDVAISIYEDDIREKIRQRKIANLLVFVVDASGSMGAMKRMTEAKGAVLSLLKDAYVKRDKVAMVTFRGDGAQVVLSPTGSAERGYRMLADIQTGGKTPLNAGIQKGYLVIQTQLRQRPDLMPLMIILTDGKGNVSLDSEKKPTQELLEIGEKISRVKQIETMVVDIERSNIMQFGIARRLADALQAKYYKLDQLKSQNITDLVKRSVASNA
jgi:magnesium chelatase subunit D